MKPNWNRSSVLTLPQRVHETRMSVWDDLMKIMLLLFKVLISDIYVYTAILIIFLKISHSRERDKLWCIFPSQKYI